MIFIFRVFKPEEKIDSVTIVTAETYTNAIEQLKREYPKNNHPEFILVEAAAEIARLS